MMIETVNGLLLTVAAPDGEVERLLMTDAPMRPFSHLDADVPNRKGLNRVVELPSWSEDIYTDPDTMSGSIGAGGFVLSNGDHALSYLRGYSFQRVEWRRGHEGLPWAAWDRVMAGRPETPGGTLSEREPSRLPITMTDLRDDLSDDVQARAYAGTNVGAAGLEGGEDAAGRPVPLALGDLSAANAPPTVANASLRIYQSHDGALGGVPRVYDRGGEAAFSPIGDVGAAIQSVSLTATQMCTDLARGLWRLGGSTGGDVTVDLIGAVGAGDTGPSLLAWLLQRRYAGAAALGPGFAALGPGAPQMGVYLDSATSCRDLVDLLCRSGRLWCLPDASGTWQLGRLDPPTDPAIIIDDNDVVRIEVDDASAAIPVYDVEVTWGRNHSPLTRSSMAPSVWDTARESWLRQDVRRVRDTRAAVKTRYGSARKLTVGTALTSGAAAEALADALHALAGPRADGTPRLSLRVAVEMTSAHLAVPLGATVRLVYPSEGIDQPMLLLGRRIASPSRHLMWWRLLG